jgi:PIN domain nuclease of toxin-antitoxin system
MLADPDRLSPAAFREVQDPQNEIYLSSVSIWEMLQKHQIGKLELPGPPNEYLVRKRKELGAQSLAFDEEAAQWLVRIPLHHRDPFDRMIICLALSHGMPIVTSDLLFKGYGVTIVW